MKQNTFNELKNASMKGKVFLIMENGQHIIIKDIAVLPYKNTTLGIHLDGMYVFFNERIDDLQARLDKQDKIIKELRNAIDTLNKKGV